MIVHSDINKKEVCILILQYNSSDLTLQLLASIVLYEAKKLNQYRIIVMDNASVDPKKDEILERFSFVEFIQYQSNLGFAKAHNAVMEQVEEPWVLLLNNDCILLNNAISKTLAYSQAVNADFSTCALYNEDLTTQINFSLTPSPLRRVFLHYTALNRYIIQPLKVKTKSCKVGYINGAFLMIKQSAIPQNMLFDDRYFMYTEDLDLMIRYAKDKKQGYRFSAAKVIHLGGASAKREWGDKDRFAIKDEQAVECFRRHFTKFEMSVWLFFKKIINYV